MRSHPAEQLGIDRRRFIAAATGALGALVAAACDSQGPGAAKGLLRFAELGNEKLERALFRHTAMDVPSSTARAAGSRFPSYFISKTVPMWDEDLRGVWRLEVGGLVDRPVKLSLVDLAALPRI